MKSSFVIVLLWSFVVLKQLETVANNFVPEKQVDPITRNLNFTVAPTIRASKNPSTIPKTASVYPTFTSVISEITLQLQNELVVPTQSLTGLVQEHLPWPASWRYKLQQYLNASNIADPDRRFIIENQMYYCPEVQLCNITLNATDLGAMSYRPCCDRCSCTVDCVYKGTCCPDYNSTELKTNDVIQEICILPQFRKFMVDSKNFEKSYYMTFNCLKSFKNKTMVSLCKNIEEYPRTREKFLSHIPVTSNATKVIYRNIYCALCNNEEEKHLLVWKSSVRCQKKLYFFPTSFISLLEFIQKEKGCNIFFYPTSDSDFVKQCSGGEIAYCNQTGEMESYDPVLEIGCKSYTSVYNGIYRNVHCFMCNHIRIPQIYGCGNDGQTAPTDMAAFGALLDFNVFEDEEETENQHTFQEKSQLCHTHEIYDSYKNVCRPIECSEGFVYFNNTCKRIYTEEFIKSYEVYFRSNKLNVDCLNITCIFSHISSFIMRKMANTRDKEFCALNVILDRETLHCIDLSNTFESTTVVIHLEMSSTNLHTVGDFIADLLGLQDEPITITNCRNNKTQNTYMNLRVDSYKYAEDITFGAFKRTYVKPGTSEALPFRSLRVVPGFFCRLPLRLVRVMNNIACPRISLHKLEYNFTFVNGDLCIKGIDECFRSGYYTNKTDKIIVCKDDYLSRTSNLRTLEPPKCQTTVDYVLNIVTFICLILSMGSLVITLVIYCCFRELRTIPGKNNMLLSSSLLVAQLLFLFGSGKNELETGCRIIGLFLHLFWLFSIFMMSSSTIHMFRVFAVFEKPKNFEVQSNSALVKYTIYSFTMSGIFVLINVVSSLLKTGGKEMGYGGCICYISTKLMVGITFALPVAIVVLSNFILFVIVMVSIQKLSKLKTSSGNHRNSFVIYIKLSCLTGLTWVFGFINEIIQSKVLSYLFVVFNAGQGIYIMLAFICNKRVLRLFRSSERRKLKTKHRYITTTRNSSTESKQTLTSFLSVSTVVDSLKEKKDIDNTFNLSQDKTTRL